ncbi:hypothetical protein EDD85DRAFT_797423 [Armillaria nabsnona]|nr:hypothetical protein EDD85DRAFT_797423 [Armillaria nabsnona]
MIASDNNASSSPSLDQQCPKAPANVLPDRILLEIFAFGTDSTNKTHLLTSLNVRVTASADPFPILNDSSCKLSKVFPSDTLILERSGNKNLDFHLLRLDDEIEQLQRFTQKHFFLLSYLHAGHAHHLQTFKVLTEDWPSICIKIPQLDTHNIFAFSGIYNMYEDSYDFDSVAKPKKRTTFSGEIIGAPIQPGGWNRKD